MRLLTYNPQKDSSALLSRLTCGENRIALLNQIRLALEAEIGRKNHQHHLIIGPRGSGKSHLIRIITDNTIPGCPKLNKAYIPIPMPEETPLRSPADLLLKILEKLADTVSDISGKSDDILGEVRAQCLLAIRSARPVRHPVDRLEIAAEALARVSIRLNAVLLPTVENLDNILFRGHRSTWKKRDNEHWALRKHLQNTRHLLIVATSPTRFGAIDDHEAPLYGFFQVHSLDELENDALIQIIERRLNEEKTSEAADTGRAGRVEKLRKQLPERKNLLRGVLAITGGMPRYAHLVYDVIVDTDVKGALDTLNGFLDELTPYFQQRLDPRLIPAAELDLLHTLAMARGPLRPTELSDRMYGVPVNEVSQLLIRLREKGLVKSIGKPGKKKLPLDQSRGGGKRSAVWDLTEPLYRVWTQFRFTPSVQGQYALLAEIVAILFTRYDIKREQRHLSSILKDQSIDRDYREQVMSRKSFLDFAYDLVGKDREAQIGEMVSPEKIADIETAQIPDFQTKDKGSERQTHLNQATTLFNLLNDAKAERNLKRRDELLEELRRLSSAHPEDGPTREKLAKGLFNTLNDAKAEEDLKCRDELLDELRTLSSEHPADGSIRESLAKGLFNALNDAKAEGDLKRRYELLGELRRLSSEHPADGFTRESLAMGLFNTLVDAKAEEDLKRRDELLDELRRLSSEHPEDGPTREKLASGLVNTLNHAKAEEDLKRRDELLDELRRLSSEHPEDGSTREKLARGLFNTLNDTKAEEDLKRRDDLLEELRRLSSAHPEDGSTREELAKGLFNTLVDVEAKEDLKRRDELLDELRGLSSAHPEDGATRELLALGLFNTHNDAKAEEDLERRDDLLDELRGLSSEYPEDGPTKDQFAKVLVNTLHDARAEKQVDRADILMNELLALQPDLSRTEETDEILQSGVGNYGLSVLETAIRDQNFTHAEQRLSRVEHKIPEDWLELVRLLKLALFAARDGFDNALIKEPEEVRRVVKIILNQAKGIEE